MDEFTARDGRRPVLITVADFRRIAQLVIALERANVMVGLSMGRVDPATRFIHRVDRRSKLERELYNLLAWGSQKVGAAS